MFLTCDINLIQILFQEADKEYIQWSVNWSWPLFCIIQSVFVCNLRFFPPLFSAFCTAVRLCFMVLLNSLWKKKHFLWEAMCVCECVCMWMFTRDKESGGEASAPFWVFLKRQLDINHIFFIETFTDLTHISKKIQKQNIRLYRMAVPAVFVVLLMFATAGKTQGGKYDTNLLYVASYKRAGDFKSPSTWNKSSYCL